MFSICQDLQVKYFKLHCESDLEHTTVAPCGTVLISLKAQGNTSHVIIMSIVCIVHRGSACWRVWVGDKGERFSRKCSHAWKHSTVQTQRDVKGTRHACTHRKTQIRQ